MTTVIEFYISDKEREIVIEQLSEFFTKKKNCKDIEKGIYDFTKQYCKSDNSYLRLAQAIYIDCAKNIMFNLKDENNHTIKKIKKLIDKNKYNAYNLAFLNPEELNKDNWIKIIARKQMTEETLNQMATVEWKPCYACKNTSYHFYQLQTRSADEPMTTFYICKNCMKTYKVNN
ncbi:transcription factor S-II-related protein [Acanthamoeba polyphaga mimivirus]|uniref:Transcription factor S-II-related protein n=1 Tax=Acanthamoeba polyphaga mimivirus Kroon TaxID=3069720 RepID=A0A0G2Y8F5_9VIRU|nr:transcription factor S-II-related protein [Acanthamoeba polyphaga mimivirus]AKI80072.1 transcription factor S-II-related protein [Acanthamoeba polyphaga mimivirus Kroon]